ncbi:MAG: hypothetical protein K0R36_1920 [Chryseobacterium sp.]|jgi:hypothetical protein|uniref:hypothetical protein n=1 Tax=Chryseobacterium sp. TaxID=1871047 RepID=UPI0026100F8F|nr:hypothetical protein [Chryseobacterium sp.]MDF2551466.1 hypothetical protein [Chryseobacterium sp.]MDF2932589.1 hypothetical protein [Chryseobacterium sp.]
MKKLLISTVLLFGLSMSVYGQKRPPAPPHPSKTELTNSKSRELQKRYNAEKKLIMNHPIATKKMKQEQLKALNLRYQNEKKLLRSAR